MSSTLLPGWLHYPANKEGGSFPLSPLLPLDFGKSRPVCKRHPPPSTLALSASTLTNKRTASLLLEVEFELRASFPEVGSGQLKIKFTGTQCACVRVTLPDSSSFSSNVSSSIVQMTNPRRGDSMNEWRNLKCANWSRLLAKNYFRNVYLIGKTLPPSPIIPLIKDREAGDIIILPAAAYLIGKIHILQNKGVLATLQNCPIKVVLRWWWF